MQSVAEIYKIFFTAAANVSDYFILISVPRYSDALHDHHGINCLSRLLQYICIPRLNFHIICPVGCTLGPAQHRIRRVVPDEPLLLRIPEKSSGYLHGNVAEQANAAGTVPDLDGRDGIFPALYAVEPVCVLLITPVKVDLILTDLRGENGRIACVQRP